jgi:hypothetical protein
MRIRSLLLFLLPCLLLASCAGSATIGPGVEQYDGVYGGFNENLFGLGRAHVAFGLDVNDSAVSGGVRVVLLQTTPAQLLKEPHELEVHSDGPFSACEGLRFGTSGANTRIDHQSTGEFPWANG